MSYLSEEKIYELQKALLTNPIILGKNYRARKLDSIYMTINKNLVDEKIEEGYQIDESYKSVNKAKVFKPKLHSSYFEDRVWALLYEFGFRQLNEDETFRLQFGKSKLEEQQIDVVAINDEVALLVECKSSEKPTQKNYKNYLEALKPKLDGFRKSVKDLVGDRRVKYILATNNQIISDSDKERIAQMGCYHLDDNAFLYFKSLIKSYKDSAINQFLSVLFKGEVISNETINIPALKGKMGGKSYYMFSIEPHHLLKIGFVLHKTRTNAKEDPTYQRLLVPSRLRKLQKFIEDGGYFPNSIILNFNTTKTRLVFEPSSSKQSTSKSKLGIVKIPHMFAIAYIIDGQHRLYGFSGTDQRFNSQIPVVAFENLESSEQLDMFLSINENQKKISPSLRLTLQEDINWNSNQANSRIVALRSGIINQLGEEIGVLKGVITIGEDKSELSANFFDNALKKAPGLLPKAKGNKLENSPGLIYNIGNTEHSKEMSRVKDHVSRLINLTYSYIDNNYPELWNKENPYFIRSNRGVFALIHTVGAINRHLTNMNTVNYQTNVEDRFNNILPYLITLLNSLKQGVETNNDPNGILKIQGQSAEKFWSMYFQKLINEKHKDFKTIELEQFNETQDEKIQEKAKKDLDELENLIKERTLAQMKNLFGNDDWPYQIPEIKKKCDAMVTDQMTTWMSTGVSKKDIDWTDMFQLLDYYKMAEKFWTTKNNPSDHTFQSFMSINTDIENEINGVLVYEKGKLAKKSDALSWLKKINEHRKTIAHLGSKSFGLTKSESIFVTKILDSFK